MKNLNAVCVNKNIRKPQAFVTFMVDPQMQQTQQGPALTSDKSFTLQTSDLEDADSYKIDTVYEISIVAQKK